MTTEHALYYCYWGKASKEDDGNSYHLLPYHCLDVVAVADIWLQRSSVLLNQISRQIGVDASSVFPTPVGMNCELFKVFHDLKGVPHLSILPAYHLLNLKKCYIVNPRGVY